MMSWQIEHEKLVREYKEKCDDGVAHVDMHIEFENRLWRMDQDKVDKKSDLYCALKDIVDIGRKTSSAEYYKQHGWHHKFSGEWVKR